jgi:aromatic ring-opening dioxygenase catalytic subunit (LigB family)
VDGLNKMSPGLDHGVFVPFKLMFGEEFTDIPVIEVSMDSTLDPEDNWRVGQAVKKLRFVSFLMTNDKLHDCWATAAQRGADLNTFRRTNYT